LTIFLKKPAFARCASYGVAFFADANVKRPAFARCASYGVAFFADANVKRPAFARCASYGVAFFADAKNEERIQSQKNAEKRGIYWGCLADPNRSCFRMGFFGKM